MSRPVNNSEVYVNLSYAEYVMSAADAAVIQSILANATRVSRGYAPNSSTYEYELFTTDSVAVETKLLDKAIQAKLALALSSST